MIKEETWTLRENSHTNAQNNSGDHLQSPRNPEGSHTIDIGTAELDEVLDKDTPGDGPLLQGNHASSNGWRSDLGLIDRNNGAGKSNGYS